MHHSRRRVLSSIGALLSLPALSALRLAASPCSRLDAEEFLACVRRGELERVRTRLAGDASLARARDDQGRSAYVLAHVHGHEQVARLLADTGLELDVVEAVLAGDWERFEALAVAEPESLNRAHPVGGSPLYAAALVGSLDFWRLRSLGCLPDVAPEGGSGFTPARAALESARASWARIALTDLCANGGDVNAPQRGGSSVLHGAVQREDATLVRLAIRKGARLDARDDLGRTPADLAALQEWQEGVQLLAKADALPRDNRSSRLTFDASGAPIEVPDLSGVPRALQSQVTGASHFNLKRVRELVEQDRRLEFSLSTDDELPIEASAHTGARPIIRYHLDQGAPLSLPTAVSLGDRAAIERLLDHDATLIHERGAHDFPVMWYSLLGGGSVEMAELLVGRGASVDQESMGATTLHWCVLREDADLARWLIERGADPEAVGYKWDRAGQTPLQFAAAKGRTAMAALLREAGARR